MNRRHAMFRGRIISLVSVVLLAGCASDHSLFARYDQSCPRKAETLSTAVVSATGVIDRTDLDTWEPAVYFGFDEARLSPEEMQRLDLNLAALARRPRWQVSVRAYADRVGGEHYNHRLSAQRLKNVVTYLRVHGLSAARIKTAALGDVMPILPNANRAQRVINRRVEMLPLDAGGRPLTVRAGAGSQDRFVPPVPVK